MTPERWKQINDLFHAALERGADAEAFVVEAAGGDEELRREVLTLITSSRSSRDFLATPAWGVAPELMFDDPSPLVGRTIGPYHVLDLIGRGGMGVVYMAEDTRLGRRVALKALAPDFGSDPSGRERLRREARAAASFAHPNIATVFALEEVDGVLYIASELVKGHSLRDEIARGALAPDTLRSTLRQIAEALAAAHDRGIVHRDLKPENIMRTPEGTIKVLDFGLAREVGSGAGTATNLTKDGAAVGTPGYMAPEQLSAGPVDTRTDVFAFGVLASELATGEHPFGPDSGAMLRRLTELMEGRQVSSAAQWSAPDMQQIARRCMRADPNERYRDGAQLVAALRTSAVATPSIAPAGRPSTWWWQFHQVAIALVLSAMPVIAWIMRGALPKPRGSWLFFSALILATISVAGRLNMLFTSRVHPHMLEEHRRVLFPALPVMDGLLAVVMMGAGAYLAGERDELAGVTAGLATVLLASTIVIEPATTRAAGLGTRT